MAPAPKAAEPSSSDVEALQAIAQSVRGPFSTVEDMTQSFIREAIVRGVFPPGQRLNLDSIASTLGVSRMPVRASLKQLESEGLLRISAYRGATVSVLSQPEIAEIYELRVLLECYLLDHVVDRVDDDLLESLENVVSDLDTDEELGHRLERRQTFYDLLYARADRPRAHAQVNTLRSSVGRYLLLQRVEEHHGHEDFLAHLRNRDAEAAKAWLTAHLDRVSTRLQGIVSAEERTAAGAP